MFDRYGRVLMGLSLALGLVVATAIASRALIRTRADELIQVTGSAKRRIRSDMVVWSADVTTRAATLAAAYKQLAEQTPKVRAYLEKKGIPAGEIVVSSVTTKQLHPRTKDGTLIEETVTGYELSQNIEVKSKNLALVAEVARAVTELIDEGISLESYNPEYHYTKVGELKVAMLGEAAKDARVRAEKIAEATGAHIGKLRSARMGVIQINPADSTEVSNEGNNDTSSIEKDIITVVGASFTLE